MPSNKKQLYLPFVIFGFLPAVSSLSALLLSWQEILRLSVISVAMLFLQLLIRKRKIVGSEGSTILGNPFGETIVLFLTFQYLLTQFTPYSDDIGRGCPYPISQGVHIVLILFVVVAGFLIFVFSIWRQGLGHSILSGFIRRDQNRLLLLCFVVFSMVVLYSRRWSHLAVIELLPTLSGILLYFPIASVSALSSDLEIQARIKRILLYPTLILFCSVSLLGSTRAIYALYVEWTGYQLLELGEERDAGGYFSSAIDFGSSLGFDWGTHIDDLIPLWAAGKYRVEVQDWKGARELFGKVARGQGGYVGTIERLKDTYGDRRDVVEHVWGEKIFLPIEGFDGDEPLFVDGARQGPSPQIVEHKIVKDIGIDKGNAEHLVLRRVSSPATVYDYWMYSVGIPIELGEDAPGLGVRLAVKLDPNSGPVNMKVEVCYSPGECGVLHESGQEGIKDGWTFLSMRNIAQKTQTLGRASYPNYERAYLRTVILDSNAEFVSFYVDQLDLFVE